MESYNMEAMSALDQVRLENVLRVEEGTGAGNGARRPSSDPSPRNCGLVTDSILEANTTLGDDGSISIGAMPSEMCGNLSVDSSLLPSSRRDASASAMPPHGGRLFTTMDLLRNMDRSLLEMPPPPSDAASESSASQLQDDVFGADEEDDDRQVYFASNGIQNVLTREKIEQDAVSRCINDELNKVMNLLNSPNMEGQARVQEGDLMEKEVRAGRRKHDPAFVYIGNVKGPSVEETTLANPLSKAASSESGNVASKDVEDRLSERASPNDALTYDGVNVLVDDKSTDAEPDDESSNGETLKLMNNTLSDCIHILEKARASHPSKSSSSSPYANIGDGGDSLSAEKVMAASEVLEDDESSLVSEKLD
eukprot:CAMPEP_0172575784 /NCGR_PEP_ID=MMETSP1067-20121228/137389_1 /TAXON_ID=265564 ORGANISM="Thalassiosira punctigera, Strain Tpunct2005C2" /NCGR_SAMPLE_ID=MMETSP1067 /ASSEMBLY_ACC=CAM_ASM_000444 /LENGTH=365 /DNA_ID=CAMNT_0013368437 /DNA_START=39 /DNA_END=1136 /DNA_ORIENTATION=+